MFDKKLIQVPEYLCAAHAGASLRVFLVCQTPTLSHYSKRPSWALLLLKVTSVKR